MMFPLLLLIPFFLLMFWSSKNQQKKQQKLVAALAKGDKVLLQGGLTGKLVEMGERYAKVEIAPGVRVDVLKSSVLGKDNVETAAAAQKQK